MKVNIWLTGVYSVNPYLEADTDDERMKNCTMLLPNMDMESSGWVKVGEGEVSLTLYPNSSVVGEVIQVLDKKIHDKRIEFEQEISYFTNQRENLLALPAPQCEEDLS